MRGVQFAVLTLFWLIAIAIIVAAIQIIPALKQPTVQDVLIKTDVYMMSSAMDAAESYLGAALQYSNYQACYELLKNGGNSELTDANKISYNNVDFGIVPERDTFMGSLKDEVQHNLNIYAGMDYSFGKNSLGSRYVVNLPEYALTLAEADGGMSASATTSGKMVSEMEVKGGNLDPEKSNINGKVSIMRDASLEAKLELDCAALYDKMKAASDDAKASATKILQDEIGKMAAGIVKDTGTECVNIKAEEEAAIKDAVNKLSEGDKTVETLAFDLRMTLDTPITPETSGPNKDKYVCKFTADGKSSLSAKVILKAQEKAPVWNGEKIKYDNMDAVFAVKAEH